MRGASASFVCFCLPRHGGGSGCLLAGMVESWGTGTMGGIEAAPSPTHDSRCRARRSPDKWPTALWASFSRVLGCTVLAYMQQQCLALTGDVKGLMVKIKGSLLASIGHKPATVRFEAAAACGVSLRAWSQQSGAARKNAPPPCGHIEAWDELEAEPRRRPSRGVLHPCTEERQKHESEGDRGRRSIYVCAPPARREQRK